jgi:hypothetical protein
MKTGKTLSQLAAEIERQQGAKRDLVASTKDIVMLADPSDPKAPIELSVGTEEFGVNDLAHDQIGNYVGIPSKYYDRMRAEAPHLLAQNVNTWIEQTPGTRLIRTLDNRTRAFLSDAYRPLENVDLAEAVLPVLVDLKVEVISCEITERRLYLKVVDKRINRDIPMGARMGDGSHNIFDTCVPAMVISNSEVGSGALSIETAIWTKACTNLAVFASDSMKRRHVGARHDLVAGEGIAELLSDETRRLTDKALWGQIRDVCKGAFDEARFDARIAKITDTTQQKIEGDPVKVVEFASKRFGMTEDERGGVLRHLIEGGSLTRYGLFNAITRTAEDLPGYDRATEFERIGGHVIDLPASQWKAISNAEGDPTRAQLLAA